MNKLWFYFFIITCVLFVDQITKNLALSKIGLGNESDFIPGFMRFYVVENTGGAFSLLREYPNMFLVIGFLNVLLFSYLIFSNAQALLQISKMGACFILGGTIGNLIDRLSKGAVTDFLDFQFIDFAIFNVADACIDVGVIIFIYGLIIQEKRQKSLQV